MRGIVCGITRVIAGSEIYGPCENLVCGYDVLDYPTSDKQIGELKDIVLFDGKLRLTFLYVKSFLDWYVIRTKTD